MESRKWFRVTNVRRSYWLYLMYITRRFVWVSYQRSGLCPCFFPFFFPHMICCNVIFLFLASGISSRSICQ
ncbi:hypothetical protein F4810DRAFT_670429 [Camillea tinctor]|nr:hypothetical protein F4810DRAFT_670429 [Camillea tinctor]